MLGTAPSICAALTAAVTFCLGRSFSYRIGRAVYLSARGDIPNNILTNGETLVQKAIVAAWVAGRREHPLVVFDVGANVGTWSAAMVQAIADAGVAGLAHVYAFEPVPDTAEVLRARMGSHPNVHVEPVAFSSQLGVRTLYRHGQHAGTNSLHPAPEATGLSDVIVVTTTASEFARSRNVAHIQLLKCDTEGHDLEVIRGALPLLIDRRISVLQFEYNHRWIYARHFLRDVFEAVETLPYKIAKLQRDKLLILDEWHPELEKFVEGNYALIHVDGLKWFPTASVEWDSHNTPNAR